MARFRTIFGASMALLFASSMSALAQYPTRPAPPYVPPQPVAQPAPQYVPAQPQPAPQYAPAAAIRAAASAAIRAAAAAAVRTRAAVRAAAGIRGRAEVRVEMAPPAPQMEVRPVAPSQRHAWIPGHWAWRMGRYVWVPGYWDMARPHRNGCGRTGSASDISGCLRPVTGNRSVSPSTWTGRRHRVA